MLSGAGFIVSVYLTYAHYRLQNDPDWQSACTINAAVSCDAALLSPYGSFGGVPLAALGAWYYGLTAVLAAIQFRSARVVPRSPALLLVLGAGLATAVSIALAVILVVSVGAFCPLCATLYAVNGAMLAVAWAAFRRTKEFLRAALALERRRWGRRPGHAAAVVAVAIGSLLILRGAYPRSTAGSSICRAVTAAALRGSDEPITISVYSDFQCPHCRTLDRDLRKLPLSRVFQVIGEHFPLDGTCNPHMKSSPHAGACLQALAAICAAGQGWEAEYRARLFDENPRSREELIALARSLDPNAESFEQCLGSAASAGDLRASIDRAARAGVRATPTLVVDGQLHVGGLRPGDLQCLMSAAERGR